jgi:serine/threonine-protein kinase
MAVMYQHVQGKAAPIGELNPDLPKDLIDVVEHAMAVDKTKRFDAMDEFRVSLEQVVASL